MDHHSRICPRPLCLATSVFGCCLAAAWGCAQPTPLRSAVVALPGNSAEAAARPRRARWRFDDAAWDFIRAKLELGAAGVLYVGMAGRRALATSAGGRLKNADTLLLDDLVGVLRSADSRYLFVGAGGDVYVTQDPLGPMLEVRLGPPAVRAPAKPFAAISRLQSISVGEKAIVAIAHDGALFRSGDGAKSWQRFEVRGLQGKASAVLLSASGFGYLVESAERAYVTHDDGLTWSPATEAQAVVSPQTATAYYTPLVPPQAEPPYVVVKPPVIFGDHYANVSMLMHEGTTITAIDLTFGQLNEAPQSRRVLVREPSSLAFSNPHFAAFGSDIVFGYLNQAGDGVSLLRSSDRGSTWRTDGAVSGSQIKGEGLDLALGPRGFTYVAALCSPESAGEQERCHPARVRPAGASKFEEVMFEESFAAREFAFDEARNRVFVVGTVLPNSMVLYESALTSAAFKKTQLPIEQDGTAFSLSVDEHGTVRVLRELYAHWALHRIRVDGTLLPTLSVPFSSAKVKLVGSRGLAIDRDRLFETNDGGETWQRVGTYATEPFACAAAGCVFRHARRIGWDLPFAASGERVTASIVPSQQPAPKQRSSGAERRGLR